MSKRILVCGGRDYKDRNKVKEVLSAYTPDCIIQGGALGADRLAYFYSVDHGITDVTFPAEWEKYGKKAGYIRNVQMLEEGKPDLVIAFPGGKGTAMMIKIAKEAGVPVMEIE